MLLGLEKIIELGWYGLGDMNALILHELGHLYHFQFGTDLRAPESTPDALLWQLFSEGVAMVFQESRLPPQLNAAACLRCALPKTGGREARIDAALRALGLAGDLDKPVREFSGGMRQRVSLARALLYPSPLILLDEPFKGLDAATRDAALAFARPLLRGRTALLVTHDPADAAALDAEVFALDATAG